MSCHYTNDLVSYLDFLLAQWANNSTQGTGEWVRSKTVLYETCQPQTEHIVTVILMIYLQILTVQTILFR